MDERVGARGPCHPDRQRPGDTIDAETEAIVVLCIARDARKMEIARMLGGRRPTLDQLAERWRDGGKDAAIALPDGEDINI